MKILATVDGSELSEAIIPPVIDLARAASAQVRLISVLDRADIPALALYPRAGGEPPPEDESVDEAERRLLDEIGQRLQELADRVRAAGLEVETHVRSGEPAPMIIGDARSWGADIIAMATHGRTGLAEQVMGSVTAAVLAAGAAPVLMIRPHE